MGEGSQINRREYYRTIYALVRKNTGNDESPSGVGGGQYGVVRESFLKEVMPKVRQNK